MKRGLATFLTGIMTVTLVAAALTGCGSSTADKRSEKVRLMVWSPSEDQSKDSGEWLQTMCNNFAKEHPEWDITFVYGVADEATAADQVAQDPEASADVFLYANDRITSLTDADAVAKFGGKYKEEIESTNSEELLDSLTVDGELYGVPFTTNTWYMFYDKSVFSEEDVKNLDTMLEKGTVSFPFTNSWYLPAFYLGNGCTLFGDGTDESKGVDFSLLINRKGVWSWESKEELHGVYYDYLITRNGEEVRSADPYAKACGVNGLRSMAVNLKKTNPKGWEKDQTPEEGPERIVYELHVKEFSWDKAGGFPEEYRGKYKAFTCRHTTLNEDGIHPTGLDYLKELGVTHIQIMPMYDYGSVNEAGEDTEFNWGYDPVNYNVPEGSYATDARHGEVRIREMKEMIQAIHEAGFGVIMDVVYNHTYSLDSWFQRTVPWYFYRVFPDGKISDGSACGNDVASEREMCAKYILESVLYWTEEYHIDGFRFDLMGLLDVDLMNRIRSELDQRYGKGKKIIYGEPWAADKTAVEGNKKLAAKENIGLLDENIGAFCDSTRDGIKGSALRAKKAGFINGAEGKEDEMLASVTAWCANPYQAEGLQEDAE